MATRRREKIVENHNIKECVEYCKEDGWQYMGLQHDNECWCGNDWKKITSLGEKNPDQGQCGMTQQGTKEYNAYGCWGGAGTNCVYDISGGDDDDI